MKFVHIYLANCVSEYQAHTGTNIVSILIETNGKSIKTKPKQAVCDWYVYPN